MDAQQKALSRWAPEDTAAVEGRARSFLEQYPTIGQLEAFWNDVKDLEWQENGGVSPWPFATSVAYQVFSLDHRDDPVERLKQRRARYQNDPVMTKYHDDLIQVIHLLEERLIFDRDPRQSTVPTSLTRLLSRGPKDGHTAVCLPDGTSIEQVRFVEATFTGLGFCDAPFFGVISSPVSAPLSGDLVLYRGTYPADAAGKPVRSYPIRQLLRGTTTAPDLRELARIFRHTSHGREGYQWGNTLGNDGDYGGEKLAQLVLLGYAKRTGRDVPNQMGGVWPEVKVTPAGARAIIESGILLQMQQANPWPVAKARGTWGEFDFDAGTGAVLGPLYGSDRELNQDGEATPNLAPIRIDVEELRATYPDEDIAGANYDVLDLGYQNADGVRVEPDEDWRAEFRQSSYSPKP
ncbi:hypothetical protein [Chromobacterium haemolyticum]|uniref:hypothetical protein n=1 Tax=Chromobacterium haemolyticum TaxID=394935 RepID=UPI00244B5D1D|nr:hypothetical protein [Chromobacterium haemolyticum]MDH0342132.1 hypothetical protein [Chromobacterium haemolyticum]